ncbi:hypothetical protein [Vibrio hyugaensis]|uniref:hypothetical protein n=1 Tax=Vibrio hyugaensis TaxID=1534743 RepID=UPI001E5228BD|nr:hypothetical protein [Vibrio hyugaensis]
MIINYGESQLLAELQPNDHFEAQIDNDKERVDFSGLVNKQSSGYFVDVVAMQESKTQHSSSSVNTQVLIKESEADKPIVIGGVNNHVMSVMLK